MRVCLVACSKTKLDHATPAKDLYCSPLFRLSRARVPSGCERFADRWYILSAKHGLLAPEAVIEPYDVTIRSVGQSARSRFLVMLNAELRALSETPARITVLAGRGYYRNDSYTGVLDYPLDGMGIGKRIAWLKGQLENAASRRTTE